MKNRYPLWKNIFLVLLLIGVVVYALPNLYPEDPAIQVSALGNGMPVELADMARAAETLTDADIPYKSIGIQSDDLLIRFNNTDDQLLAHDVIRDTFGDAYTAALNLAPSTPQWLRAIGAAPMKQGLDLRGGVHFLLEIDLNGVIQRRIDGLEKSVAKDLREDRIRYAGISAITEPGQHGVIVRFRSVEARNTGYRLLVGKYPGFDLTLGERGARYFVEVMLSLAELDNMRQHTIEQTMSILRNRVNELGVGEAVVQQKGAKRVAVDLPGIQDSARAKEILGGTATLEFRLVDIENDSHAAQTGLVPPNSSLYVYNEQPLLLQNDIILSGDSITSAMSTYDEQSGSPAVGIQLGGGDNQFTRLTRANIGNPMSIVFVETKLNSEEIDGKTVQKSEKIERVISVATIQSALGNNFQITGLRSGDEARDLALLLRAGALPAAIYPVEERTIGPSLGQKNIERGVLSLKVGLLLVLVLMALYYRAFGLIANLALIVNLIFIVAVLSMIGATLTLPGIAGIVLTMGMAVDANVLIYERIREELRNGVSPQAAIYAGYERAFSTIVDANVTTLIVALILFAIGTGPVQGFAVTLSIGILTSMLTAVVYTRAVVNMIFGGRSLKWLSIGIKPNLPASKTV